MLCKYTFQTQPVYEIFIFVFYILTKMVHPPACQEHPYKHVIGKDKSDELYMAPTPR